MNNKLLKLFLVALVVSGLVGCGSVKVKRTDVDKTIDLSGNWNDSDSRMVSEEAIKDCLAGNWLSDFNIQKGSKPVVIVGTVLNQSSEHINSDIFVSDLERSLINSGKVKFVADKTARVEVREEKVDQAENATKVTAKPSKQETGADFMLQGTINSVKDAVRGKYVVMYQVNLELINIVNNEKVWVGQKEIKKVVSRKRLGL